MRKPRLTLVIGLVALLGYVMAGIAGEPLLFLEDDNFPPYSFRSGYVTSSDPFSGIDHDTMKEAARRAGVEIVLEQEPFHSMLARVKQGTCVGGFSLFRTPDREKYAIYVDAEPLHLSEYVVFTRWDKTFDFNSFTDLYGKTVGMTEGYSLGTEFDAAVKTGMIEVVYADKAETHVRKVFARKRDCFVGNKDVVSRIIYELGLKGLVVALDKSVSEPRGAYLVLSKMSDKVEDKEALAKKLGAALQEIKKDGTYDKIVEKYSKD